MENIKVMQPFEAQSHMNQSFPNGLLVKCSIVLLMGNDFLVKISIIKKLHDYAAWRCFYQSELDSMKECL